MDVYIRKAVEDGHTIFSKKFVLTNEEKEEAVADGKKVESIEQLKRDLIPSEFAALYLNDPVDSDAIEFKPAWFQHYEPSQIDFSTSACILSIDPAFRLKQTNDFTGITISRIVPDGRIFVIEALALKLNASDLITKIFELVDIYKPGKVLLETVAAQIVLLEMMRDRMQKNGKWFVVEEVKLDTSETKAMRIRSLIPFYANNRVFHAKGLQALENQLVEFPRGLHDDIIDSLAHQTKFWKAPHLVKASQGDVPYNSWQYWKNTIRQSKNNTERLFSDFK